MAYSGLQSRSLFSPRKNPHSGSRDREIPSETLMACPSQALVWEREAKLMRKSLQGLGPWLGPEHGSCSTARQMALVSLLPMGLHKTERISPLHSLIGQLLGGGYVVGYTV